MKTEVNNITSSKGNSIANQFEIRTKKGLYYQSYDSVIAFIPDDNSKTQLDENFWDYSKTTSKYRNLFLGENKKETEQKIKEGVYELTNLN